MKLLKYFALVIILFSFGCEPCEELTLEVCGGNEGATSVDLIILIDQSGSLDDAASAISMAAEQALDSAQALCPTDLVVHFLGVDGTQPGTRFNENHKQFIYNANGGTIALASDNSTGDSKELGANAIEDLSNLAPWRTGACRAIFYISDEELDSDFPTGDFANETAKTQAAIDAAKANGVTVFTNYILALNRGPNILQNYDDLTGETGGFNLTTPTYSDVNEDLYIELMPNIVCNSCNSCVLNQFVRSN